MSHSSLSSAELEKSNYVFFAPTMWNLAELNPRPIALVTVQLAMQWLQLFDIKMYMEVIFINGMGKLGRKRCGKAYFNG